MGAKMRKERKHIDLIEAIDIIREAFKVLSTHSRMFMLNQLTLMLPFTTLIVLFQYATYRMFPQPDVGDGRIPRVLPSRLGAINFGETYGINSFVGILAVALYACVVEAAHGLASSATLYAVGLHYTGQSVAFKDVVRASIPRLWARLTVTNVYGVLVVYSLLLFDCIVSVGLFELEFLAVRILGLAAMGLVTAVGWVCVGVVFRLAGAISVLEKDYGWAAVRRTPKLLKGRVLVVLFVQAALSAPIVVSLTLAQLMRLLMLKGDSPLSIRAALSILLVAQICWLTFVWQLVFLCNGVQYASFKAYHNEDLEESMYEKPTMKAGYERVAGSETNSVETL